MKGLIVIAANTDPALQWQVIYSVFVRNHTEEGTFRALIPDLDRIRGLGVDVIWLMPIHPIGVVDRKGSLGCPYSIRDYRAVNPEYGTMEDFRALLDAIHSRGMRCIIDVVYNHTAADAVLLREHPEFYYRAPDGSPYNRIGDWSDVRDLNYGVPALWDYQLETLKFWARLVDGFRCDVASFVPVAFWARARAEIAKEKPDFLWLAETVHRDFGALCRRHGIDSARDVEIFEAFDLSYEYDVRDAFDRWLDGRGSLRHWADLLDFQDFAFPASCNKLRFLENHDTPRIAGRAADLRSLRNMTAMLYFMKGTTLLYAGQERAARHTPSLFDADKVDWSGGTDLSPLLRALVRLKRETLSPEDSFSADADEERSIVVMTRDDGKTRKLGVFSLRGLSGEAALDLPDGSYPEQLSGGSVKVRNGKVSCDGEPLWITAQAAVDGRLE